MTRITTRPPHSFLATSVLFIGAVILSLAISELVLRLIPKNPPVYYRKVSGDEPYLPDPYLGWRLAPNSRMRIYSPEYDIRVAINSRGIRGPEIPAAMPDKCRILIIGDSFAAGFTVDYKATFGQVAQRLLARSGDHDCAVLSAGVDGYSTDQELLLLQEIAPGLSPTLTILFFFFNDIYCNISTSCFGYNKPVFRMTDGDQLTLTNVPVPEKEDERKPLQTVTTPEPETANRTLRQWLQSQSHLYRLLRRELKIALGRQERIPLRSSMFIKPLPDYYQVFRQPYDATTAEAWRITEKLIMKVSQAAKDNGSEFILFHVPLRESIHPQEWQMGLQAHRLDGKHWNSGQVEAELRKICRENSIRCILPAERFRLQTEIDGRRHYLTNDPHWNEAGHGLAGRILAEAITGTREQVPGDQTVPQKGKIPLVDR